ncbi:MAG: TSUP family transporter [Actinomycetota bacterium]
MSGPEILIALSTGLLAGAFAGAMGVGGGVIMVPVLVELLDAGQHTAQGTSLAVIIVTAIVGTIASNRAGLLDIRIAAWVAIGGIAGGVAGSTLALTTLDEQTLRRIFGVVVLATAARILSQVLAASRNQKTGS